MLFLVHTPFLRFIWHINYMMHFRSVIRIWYFFYCFSCNLFNAFVSRFILSASWLTFDPTFQNDTSKLDHFARRMLHGKGYDRWFDKSFNIVVGTNGRVSHFNIFSHSSQQIWKLTFDFVLGWIQFGTLVVSLHFDFSDRCELLKKSLSEKIWEN